MVTHWRMQIEQFITHYIWSTTGIVTKDGKTRSASKLEPTGNQSLKERLRLRLVEMKERRKRLFQLKYEQDGKNGEQFEREYKVKEERKEQYAQKFSIQKLEEMLRVTTKNAAYEVVSCLVEFKSRGVLTSIIEWMNREQNKKTHTSGFQKREDGSHSARGAPPQLPNFFSEKRNEEEEGGEED